MKSKYKSIELSEIQKDYDEASKKLNQAVFTPALFHIHTPASHDFQFSFDDSKRRLNRIFEFLEQTVFNQDKAVVKQLCFEQTNQQIWENILIKDIVVRKDIDLKIWIQYLDLALSIISLDVGMVVITDHNTSNGFKIMGDAIRAISKQVNTKAPKLIPGIEVSAGDGLHIVGIFSGSDTLRDFDNEMSQWKVSEKIGYFQPAWFLMEKIREYGGLSYVAHINTAPLMGDINGASHESSKLTSAFINKLNRDENLKVVGIKEIAQKDKVLNRLNNLGLKNSRQAFVIDSDAHSAAKINDKQIFWLKVEAKKFSGIKQAFIDPEISISLSRPEVNRNYIKYIKFTNSDSFLGGLTIPFSDAMTAVIGARGTGKSSSIDYINLVFTYRYKHGGNGREHQHLWHLLNQGNAFICLIFAGEVYIVHFEALNFKDSKLFDSDDDKENIENFLSVLNESEKRSVTGMRVGRAHLTSQVVKKVIRKKITIYSVSDKGELIDCSNRKITLLNHFEGMFNQNYSLNDLSDERNMNKMFESFFSHLPKYPREYKIDSLQSFQELYSASSVPLHRKINFIKQNADKLNIELSKIGIRLDIREGIPNVFHFANSFVVPQILREKITTQDLSMMLDDIISSNRWTDIYQMNQAERRKLVSNFITADTLKSFYYLHKSGRKSIVPDVTDNELKSVCNQLVSGINGNEIRAIEQYQQYLGNPIVFNLQFNINAYKQKGVATYKPLYALSSGQKVVALLSFIIYSRNMSQINGPIILDQPEDFLDGRYIYTTLVSELRKIKSTRQIIVVTHNSAIVTNAKPETILVLGVENSKSILLQSGYLSEKEIVRSVLEILEGGKDSFRHKIAMYSPELND